MNHNKCSATTRLGKGCNMSPLPGSTLCRVHDPSTAAKAREERSAGGRARTRYSDEELEASWGDASLIKLYLARVAEQVHVGHIDTKVANCLAILAGNALRAVQLELSAAAERGDEERNAARKDVSLMTDKEVADEMRKLGLLN